MSALRNQKSAYCPTCEIHSEQGQGRKRGERLCGGCGNSFTLEQSYLGEVINEIPSNWLDPLLTGEDAVIGKAPYSGQDIERLLSAIKKRQAQVAGIEHLLERSDSGQ